MDRNSLLTVALVGCGQIAETKHLPALGKIPGVRVVAVCDQNEVLARKLAERFGIHHYYTDLTVLLHQEKVDMVDICTPPQTHLAISAEAMATGCHVLTEKPMALDYAEARQMAELAALSKLKLCVIHNELFIPVVMKAREMVSRNITGDIVEMKFLDTMPRHNELTVNSNHWCHRLPGGMFGEMLPHPIYLALAFLGNLDVVNVFSRNISGRDWLVADELRVLLKNDMSTATIVQSVNVPEDTTEFDLIGTRMSLRVEPWSSVIIPYLTGRESRFSRARGNIRRGWNIFTGTAATGFNIATGTHPSSHYTLIKSFIESLRNGSEPPVTIEEALNTVRLYQEITSQIKS